MFLIQQYIDYLKDNPKGYWFKRKLYGWGWTPARWQGWATLLFYLVFVVLDFIRIDRVTYSSGDTLGQFLPQAFLLTLVLIVVCYKKGESPKWQWGDADTK